MGYASANLVLLLSPHRSICQERKLSISPVSVWLYFPFEAILFPSHRRTLILTPEIEEGHLRLSALERKVSLITPTPRHTIPRFQITSAILTNIRKLQFEDHLNTGRFQSSGRGRLKTETLNGSLNAQPRPRSSQSDRSES